MLEFACKVIGVRAAEALPKVCRPAIAAADMAALFAEARDLAKPLAERSLWATTGEGLGYLAVPGFDARAGEAISREIGEKVVVQHHVPFVDFRAVNHTTGASVSYILPAGAASTVTVGEGAAKRVILGPRCSTLHSRMGPMAGQGKIPLKPQEAGRFAKGYVSDLMDALGADQAAILMDNGKCLPLDAIRTSGAGLVMRELGGEAKAMTPTAYADWHARGILPAGMSKDNVLWVIDRHGNTAAHVHEPRLHRLMDAMTTQHMNGFVEAGSRLEGHYPHVAEDPLLVGLFADVQKQLAKGTSPVAQQLREGRRF